MLGIKIQSIMTNSGNNKVSFLTSRQCDSDAMSQYVKLYWNCDFFLSQYQDALSIFK